MLPKPSSYIDFDPSLLEINLKMSVEDRLRTHDEALEVALEFEKAGRGFYSKKDEDESRASNQRQNS